MKRAFLLAALAIILCVGWATVASAAPTAPYSSNADCTFCHDVDTGVGAVTRVEFDVPAAMRTRCNACHSMYHWNHYNFSSTCQGCHHQRPDVYAAFPPPAFWDRTKGFFVSEASMSASPTTIHSVHVNGSRWENDRDDIDGMSCAPCHAPAACSACHGNDVQPGHANHTGGAYPAVTYVQGDGNSRYLGTTTCVNASCHDLADANAQQFVPTCASCHAARVTDHGYDLVQHTADVTETVDGGGKVCGDCHSMVLLEEHTRASASSKDAFCANCHAQPRGSFGAWNQTCSQGGCHATATSAEPHNAISTSHTVSAAAEAQICVDCHDGDLAAVHTGAVASGDASKTSCLVCHSRTSVPATNNCTTCHFTYDAHPYPQAAHESDSTLASCGGSGCHSTRDLLGAHQEKNPAYVCNDCHNSPRTAVQDSIASGSTSCSSCHTGVSETVGHRAQHAAAPALVEGGLPKYAFLTGSAPGGAYTSACASCHTSNLIDAHLGAVDPDTGASLFEPQKDFSGATLTCANCHDSSDPYVVAGISPGVPGGTTKCDQCHKNTLSGAPGIHGAINQLHTSTFVDSPQVKCAPCHTDNLVDQHNGGMTAVGGDGRVLAYCDICHDNYGGTRGPVVQTAIEVANDTRCSACHSATHPDFDSHSASSAASLECGSCHAAGQSSIDVKAIHAGASAGPCAVCHDNPARVPDIRNETAECASCHAAEGTDYHRDFAAAHGAPGSQACVDCHETADVVVLHAETAGNGCVVCHDNAPRVPSLPSSTACVNCHSDLSPADPDHYPAPTHEAADGTESGFTCSACHKLGMKPEHAKASSGGVACVQCHETKVDAFTGPWNASCDACHAPRHAEKAAKHASSTTQCAGAGCHAVTDVAALHTGASTTVAGETFSSCAVCHRDSDAVPTTTTCTDCHDGHGDLGVAHTAVASVGCTSCHETGDVRELHPSCTTCHDGRALPTTTECANCHGELSPADPNHYGSTPHVANDASQYGYACSACHKLEMKPEHAKTASGAVSCVQCHETKVDGLGGPWDKSCADCHGSQHGEIAVKHASSTTECSGAGCHVVSDVGALHSAATTTVAGITYNACRVCHRNDDSIPASTACRDCHDGHGDLGVAHTAVASVGCTSCHETGDVRQLHPSCTTCHDGRALPATTECVNCHSGLSPADPNHYAPAPHSGNDGSQYGYACSTCHKLEMKPEHAKSSSGSVSCVQCHETKVDGLGGAWDKSCADCHGSQHGQISTKHVSTTGECSGAGCHVISDVGPLHSSAATTVAGDTYTACRVCHRADSSVPTSTACRDCHQGHGDIAARHTAASSGACTACHETADVRTIHPACTTCHDGRDLPGAVECTSCHPTLSPADPNHYPTASHAAVETACNQCHYLDLKQEHFKPTSGPVSCVQCHETKVDSLASAWNDLCTTQCHATKHGDQNAKHVSTNTTCSGTGCHAIGDVSGIHQALPAGGCSACHKSASQPATTTNCSTTGCHDGVTGNHHAMHDTTGVIDTGCKGCHFTYLDDEHAALGYTCATCHSSTNPAVAGAITANDRNCLTCHPNSAHNARQAAEFAPSNASMHRVNASLPGMRSSFVVSGVTYTMSLPSASSFLKSGYAIDSMVTCNMCHTYSGSTGPHGATMKVNIDPAYPNSYKATGGGSGSTAQLSPSSPTGMSMSDRGSTAAGIICEKCHDLNGTGGGFGNIVHSEHDNRGNEGGYCNHCHVSIPHGWGRPRLLGYTTDSAAYRTTTGGLQRFSLKNYTPSSWAKSDCGAGCSSSRHPVSGSTWPNAFALGSLSGRVLDTLGNAVSGATVTISGGGSATTGTDGRYTITGVSAGSVSVTASKTGYTSQTKTSTVNAAQATTLDFSLTLQPVATNLARNKAATASSQYSSSYSAAKAVDGSTSTYWQSSSSGTQWVRVDLGSSQSLSKVVINWNSSYYARSYRVETSTDGSNWTQRYSTTSGTSGTKTHTFAAVSARYVRVYCTSANSTSYRVNEFEVWDF